MLSTKITVRKLLRASKFLFLGSIIIFSLYSQSLSNIFLSSSLIEPYSDGNPEPAARTNDNAAQTLIHSERITTSDSLQLIDFQDTRPLAQSNLVSKNNGRTPSYIGHAPISINGDADFLVQNASDPFCWTGDGTLATPYIIEDLNITSSSTDACIAITNIQNIHFTIKNCWLDGNHVGTYAIYLTDIATLTIITNNIIQNATNRYIEVWDSSGCIISNNSLLKLGAGNENNDGVYIYNGTVNGAFIKIYDNYFYASTSSAIDAITLYYCNNNTIVNNTITGSETALYECGIHFFYSNNTLIEKNHLNKTYEGIWAEGPSYNITIHANSIQDTPRGIDFEYMWGICSVWENTINNSAQEGVVISRPDQMKALDFRDNIISNCATGFITSGSNHTIWNNTLLNNDYGIYLDTDADNVTIWANHFLNSATSHGYDTSSAETNFWDNGTHGNWWDDYYSADWNEDGIGDTPYTIAGGTGVQDRFPIGKLGYYVSHAPIFIDGDADFLVQNASDPFCWAGNGTLANPYIIERLNITLTAVPSLPGVSIYTGIIQLHNLIDVHVSIQNCWLNGKNMYIINDNRPGGILLSNITSQNIIQNNIIQNTFGHSIYTYNCPGSSRIAHNNCTQTHSNAMGNGINIKYDNLFQSEIYGRYIINDNYISGIRLDAITLLTYNLQRYPNPVGNITIANNTIVDCDQGGILNWGCANLLIKNNTLIDITSNAISSSGHSQNSTIINNFIDTVHGYSTSPGISLTAPDWMINPPPYYIRNYTVWGNSIMNRGKGVWIGCDIYDSIIGNNRIINCTDGIYDQAAPWDNYSKNITFCGNRITNCTNNGMFLEKSDRYSVYNNTFTNNTYGIYIDTATGNCFLWNNTFINNAVSNAYDANGTNFWDNGTHGNWWDDYKGVDLNGDGIGDIPYNISGGVGAQDRYPRVEKDETPPTIDHPEDIFLELGITGWNLTWYPNDTHPYWYKLFLNGTILDDTLLHNTTWSGEAINITLDGYEIGFYNFTIVVYDNNYNWISDTVWMTVLAPLPPELEPPEDFAFKANTTGNFLIWNCSDVSPLNYSLYENESVFLEGEWNGSDLIFNISAFEVGVYNFTLVLYDQLDLSTNGSIWVKVIPLDITTLPTSLNATEGSPFFYDFNASAPLSQTLTWSLAGNCTAWLTINDSTGEVTGTPPYVSAGMWNLTVNVTDENVVSDIYTVFLTVEPIPLVFTEVTPSQPALLYDIIDFTARVVTNTSVPAEDVAVEWWLDGILLGSAITNSTGYSSWTLQLNTSGTHQVEVKVSTRLYTDIYLPTTGLEFWFNGNATDPAPVWLTLGDEYTISGQLVDEDGNPIPDVELTFIMNNISLSSLQTDPNGWMNSTQAFLTVDTYKVTVLKNGIELSTGENVAKLFVHVVTSSPIVSVISPTTGTAESVIGQPVSFVGWVYFNETPPIAVAGVRMGLLVNGTQVDSLFSDSNGYVYFNYAFVDSGIYRVAFYYNEQSWGDIWVTVTAGYFVSWTGPPTVNGTAGQELEFTIYVLSNTSAIRRSVTLILNNGTPVIGAEIEWYINDAYQNSTITGADGRASFKYIFATIGFYRVVAQHEGQTLTTFEVFISEAPKDWLEKFLEDNTFLFLVLMVIIVCFMVIGAIPPARRQVAKSYRKVKTLVGRKTIFGPRYCARALTAELEEKFGREELQEAAIGPAKQEAIKREISAKLTRFPEFMTKAVGEKVEFTQKTTELILKRYKK